MCRPPKVPSSALPPAGSTADTAPAPAPFPGTIAPRGPLHEFLAAINPAYVGSAAVQAALGELPGEYDMWVVEHSNVHSLASRAQLEGLLELHAYLVEPQAGAEVPLPAAGAPAPAPAGPAEEAVAAGRVAELIRQFVEDAYDGQGRWNWWVQTSMAHRNKQA